jgi:hypothetical protein
MPWYGPRNYWEEPDPFWDLPEDDTPDEPRPATEYVPLPTQASMDEAIAIVERILDEHRQKRGQP